MNKSYHHPNFLVCFSILLFILLGFQAKSQSIRISNDTICEGETGFIPVSIVGGQNVAGFSLTILVSNPGITYLGIDSLDPRFSSAQISFDSLNRRWNILWFNLNPVGINGTICRLQLRSLSSAVDSIQWLIANCQLSGPFLSSIPISSYQHGAMVVNPESAPVSISASICAGQQFSLGNQIFTSSGQYSVTLLNQWGCDSVINLQLTVQPNNTILASNNSPTTNGQITVLSSGSPSIVTSLGSAIGNVGDTVSVPVAINMASGISISSLALAIDYDVTKLQCVTMVTDINSAIYAGFLSNCGIFSNLSANPPFYLGTRQQFRAAWFNLIPVAFNGLMFNIRFKILAPGSHDLAWDLATPGNCEYGDDFADVIPNTAWNNGVVMSGLNSNYTGSNSCNSSLVSPNNTQTQNVGVYNSIQPIIYQTFGATGAIFSGLPPGISGVWSNNYILISGAPTGTGLFPFSFTLTGFNCISPMTTQSVCVGQSIQDIIFITTGATGVVASGLPPGVTANWVNNQVIIGGTPTSVGDYNYIVSTTGGCPGVNDSVMGRIVVNSLNTISIQGDSANRTVCLQQSIGSINILTMGATGAYAVGLPPGIVGEWIAGVFTISGSTTLAGFFPYTVRMTGGCPGGLDSINGIIHVLPHAASSIQASICIGQSFAFGSQSLNQSGVYSRTVVGANGCDSVITLTLDVEPIDTTYLGVSGPRIVYSNDFQNNSFGWNTSQMHGWNGSQMLGPFSNMNLEFNQSNLPTHDSLFVEFDFYLHDSWDASEPFQISLNGQALGTYFFGYWYNSSYPELTYLGIYSYSARCYWYYWNPWRTHVYRARFKVPHTSSTMNFRINVLGDQDPCDESWSLDNFKVETNQYIYKICEGTSLTVGNQSLTNAGHYEILVPSSAGCDSLVIVDLALKPRSDTTRLYRMLCTGETLNYQGQGIQSQGIYHFQLTNVLGCDSVVEYTVDTMPTSLVVQANGSCLGASLIVSPTVPDWTKIEWLRGNTVVQSRLRTYETNPTWTANSSHPAGIFYHQNSGAVYVVEHGHHRVVRWLPGSTSPQVVAGGNGAGSGSNQLHGPYDLFVTPSGSVYVSDYNNARVQRWDPGANSGVTVAGGHGQGSANHQLYQPIGVWVDALERLYVADYGNNRVVRWDQGASTGAIYRMVDSPTDILFDQNSNFYAASNNQHTVFRWAPGSNQAVAAAFARNPHQIAIDGGGDLWVTQHMNNRVSRHHFSSPNEISLNLNLSCNPFGIAITDSGSLYVGSHLCSQTVSRFSPLSNSVADTFQAKSSGQYQARVMRSNGCALNSSSHTINGTPVEIKGPPIYELCQGDTLLLESTLLRYDLQFQWLRNGQAIAGATMPSLRIWLDGDYQLRATDSSGCSVISKRWSVMGQPISQMAGSCPSNVLTIESQGSNHRSIQWYRNDTLVQSDHLNFQGGVHRGSTNYGAKGTFIDSYGNVYVADTESDRVLRFTSASTSGTVVAGGNGRGSGAHQLNRPSSIFVDSKGVLYVSDQYNHRIMAWSPGSSSGMIVAGGNGPGSGNHQLNEPYGVCMNAQGQLMISDQQNHRIVRWTPGAQTGTRILGITGLAGMAPDMLNLPAGLFLDSKGFLYIADRNNHRIQRWVSGSLFSQTVAGGNGGGSQLNQLNNPGDVFVDAYGAVYVSDYGNHRVVMWSNGIPEGLPLLESNLVNGPRGIQVDTLGNIYVMSDGWASLRSYNKVALSDKKFIPLRGGHYTAKALTYGGCLINIDGFARIPEYVVVHSNSEKEVCMGDTLRLTSIQDTGLSYQWQRNGIDIPGATGLNFEAVQEGHYRLKASGGVGCSYSRETSVRPLPAASLNANVVAGCNPGVITMTCSDDNIAGVQWYRDGVFQHRWESQYITTFSNSGFNSPHGVFIDKSGNIYIADFENDRVLRRDGVNGAIQVVAGGNGRGSALNQLNRPVMVHVDDFGWVYVSDMGNHRVMKWALGGTTGQIVAGGNGAGSMLNQLNQPHGITLDAFGALIVVDHSNHRVMRWVNGSVQGTVIAGGQGSGSQANQLNGPAGISIGYDGTIYVADYYNNRIQAWTSGSNAGVTVATGSQPWGLAMDAAGTLYFTSRANHHVMQWRKGAQTGRVIVGYNGTSHVVGSLNDPTGLSVDSKGGICVAERGYGSIHYVKPENLSGKPYQTMAAGTYTAKLFTYGGCEVDVQGSVNFVPQASVWTSNQGEACFGDTLALRAIQQTGLSYQWQRDGLDMPGETGAEFRTVLPGTYRLMVVNQQGCTTTSEDYVLRPTPSFGVSTLAVCPNDTPGVQLAITGNDSILSGIAWLRNGIVHNYQDAKYTQVLQQLYQVPSMYHPWYGWVSNLNSPQGIHIDREGNLYVADTEFDRIVKWSPNGGQGVVVAGGNGRGAGLTQLDRPLGVFVDERGWIYVSDQGNHRVVRWIQGQGVGTVVAGGRGNGFNLNQLSSPHGIWVHRTGDVFVSDNGNHRVVKWIPGADTGSVVAGGNGPGSMPNQLYHPAGICMNQDGELFVADQYNHRVQRWSIGASNGVTVAGGNGQGARFNQLSHPWDVSVLGSGSVYISDRGNHRAMLWRAGSINGQVVGGYNGYGNSAGQLNDPSGIRIDRQGNLYIAERGRQWVQSLAHEPLTSMTFPTSDVGLYTARAYTREGCLVDGNQCGLLVKVTSSSGNLVCEGQATVLTGDSIPGCTYQWIKDGVHLQGATSRFLMAQSSGSYRLMVSHPSGCRAQSCAVPVWVNPSASIHSTGNLCFPGLVQLSSPSLVDTNVVSVQWYRGNEEVGQNQMRLDPLANLEVNNYDYPSGVFLGRNGKDLYFTQPNQHRVVKKDLETGVIQFVAGQGGGGSGLTQMNYPLGVFAQRQGEIFVADHNNHRVMRYEIGSSSGSVVAGGNGAGSGMNQLYGPYGVFVDPQYHVYVVDHHNHRIQRWAPGASSGVTVAGGNGAGSGLNQLYYPTNMVIGPDGWMYIVDKGNHRVLKWRPGENSGMVVAGGQGSGGGLNQLSSPHDVQVDVAGSLYITDQSNHRIMRWRAGSAFGEVVTGGIGAGGALSQLSTPQGLGMTSDGNLYTADHYNHRLLRYEAMGMDTHVFAPTMAGIYSAKVFYRNGCSTQTNSIRLGQDTTDFGNDSYTVQNNFTQNSSGWNTNQRFSYLGNQALGPFANQSLSYFNQNVPPYDTAYFEFDWNIHDSWDNNEPFYVTANGHLLGTFYFWTWGTANYPQLEPLGQSGTRCSGYPTRTYRARFAAPHGIGNNVSFSINQWNAEDVCNESWSIDNFRVTAGRSVTLCQGDTVWMGSMPLVSSGLHRLILTNQLGCDSVVQAYVQVKPRPADTTIHVQICAGGSYLFGSLNLTQSGRYTRVTTSHNGCDSTIHLELMVHPVYSTQTNRSLCYGQTFGFNGNALSTSGVYTAMLTASTGCDSMVTLHLTVADSINPTTLVQSLCMGDTLNLQGQTFWQGGSYTVFLTSHTGCDSLVYLDLQVANPSTTVIYDTIAFGSEIWIGNQLINSTGSYSIMLSNNQGCDSLVTVNLVVLNSPLKGVLRYQNSSLTPMGNVLVRLISSNTLIDSALTSGQGYFDFGVRPADTYQLIFFNPRTWGGVNATDALGISRHFTNLQLLNGLKRKAADVNVTTSINSADALLVSRRFSTIINNFNAGDFVYSIDTFSLAQGDSLFLDVRSLCYGDINGSYNPAAITRNSWSRMDEIGDLVTENGVYFLDLKAKRRMDLGAISLNLLLPEGIKVVNVHSASTVSDEPVIFKQLGRNVRIAWHHLMPWVLEEGDAMIRLELMGCVDGWLEIDEAESELANSDGVPLIDLPLIAPRLKAQSLSTIMSASVFPNPTSNRTWLSLAIRQKSSLEIIVMDAIGRQIYQQSLVDVMAGEHRLEIPSDDWSDGHYNVMVQAMNEDGAVLKRNLRLQKRH